MRFGYPFLIAKILTTEKKSETLQFRHKGKLRRVSHFQLSSRCLDSPIKHCLLCLIYYMKKKNCWLDIIFTYLCYYCEWNTQYKSQKRTNDLKLPRYEKQKRYSIIQFYSCRFRSWPFEWQRGWR